ncbi:ral guanine nucleotide dissociation stimulator-like [Planococcus citri]|uniref:ral guanine nucleotide dissociation stimulator-like n=1 Tax=Planococcus citri TaxID=170843 RepID=UPI0031F9E953
MLAHTIVLALAIGMTISAPAPNPEPAPAPAPAADPNPKPGFTPVVYTPPVAVSYNAFSSLQTHPSSIVIKSAPAVIPSLSALPTVAAVPSLYSLQAQAAPAAVGYAVNYPYVVV